MLTSGGKRVSWDVAADATTNNNPPITSTFGFYVTLTVELADGVEVIGGLLLVVASAAMSQETRFPPLVKIAVPFVDWSHSKQA